jgi:hypothetical protein
VGDVSWPASIKVPTAIAAAKTMNKMAVSLVEKRILASFSCIIIALFKV